MERRPMAPHQTVAGIDFHAFSALDFGICQNGTDSTGSHLIDAKQLKQEMHSPRHHQNAFHPQQMPRGDASAEAALDQLASTHANMEFFSPTLHQLILPQTQAQEFEHSKNGTVPYFCAQSASSSSSSAPTAPADPQPSNGTAQKRQKSAGQGNHSSKDRKRPYPCSLCSSRFGSKMELEEHQNSHTGQKPFQCDVCQSRFNRRSTLWNHKRIHSDAKPFVCTVCHMQFKWKNSLKCHKEMHLRKNELIHGGMPDAENHALTYATAAKKKMGELTGVDPATITLLPTTNASSRLLTCAGTPRKRAPPKQANGKKKPKPSSAVMAKGQTASVNGDRHPPPFGHVQIQMAFQFGGGEPKGQQQATTAVKSENPIARRNSNNNNSNAQVQQEQQNGSIATPSTGLDFFRLQCSAASSVNVNGLQTASGSHQPPAFLAIDPLRPSGSSYCPDLAQIPLALDHNGQLQMGGTAGPADLLSCNGNTAATSATANLHLSLEQPAFNLLQEFQLGGHQQQGGSNVGEQQQSHCFDQQQSLRGLSTTNFLGFDFNSLAGINQQAAAVDPRILSIGTSTSNDVHFQSNCSQFIQSGQTFAGSTSSSSSRAALNGYQFDPASMRFLAAAAEMSSNSSQLPNGSVQTAQLQPPPIMTANSVDYGLFCATAGTADYGYPMPNHHQQHGEQNQQQQQQLFNEGSSHFPHLAFGGNSSTDQHQQHQQFMSAALAHEQQQQQHLAVGGGNGDLSQQA